MKYTEIARVEYSDTGYGFSGFAALARREDGKRYRMTSAGFRWDGNNGGYAESSWFDDEEAARQFWLGTFADSSEVTVEEFFAALS